MDFAVATIAICLSASSDSAGSLQLFSDQQACNGRCCYRVSRIADFQLCSACSQCCPRYRRCLRGSEPRRLVLLFDSSGSHYSGHCNLPRRRCLSKRLNFFLVARLVLQLRCSDIGHRRHPPRRLVDWNFSSAWVRLHLRCGSILRRYYSCSASDRHLHLMTFS